MIRKFWEYMNAPAGEYRRCASCQRLRDVYRYLSKHRGRCKCGSGQFREPRAIYWHERLRIILRFI